MPLSPPIPARRFPFIPLPLRLWVLPWAAYLEAIAVHKQLKVLPLARLLDS